MIVPFNFFAEYSYQVFAVSFSVSLALFRNYVIFLLTYANKMCHSSILWLFFWYFIFALCTTIKGEFKHKDGWK